MHFVKRAARSCVDTLYPPFCVICRTNVRRGYLELAEREPGRVLVVEAGREVDEIAELIWKAVEERLSHGIHG